MSTMVPMLAGAETRRTSSLTTARSHGVSMSDGGDDDDVRHCDGANCLHYGGDGGGAFAHRSPLICLFFLP